MALAPQLRQGEAIKTKTGDAHWNSLSAICRQIWPKVSRLGYTGQFFSEVNELIFVWCLFVNNFAPVYARAMNLPSLCSSGRDGSKYTQYDLNRSTSKLEIMSGQKGQTRSKWVSMNSDGFGDYNFCQFYVSSSSHSEIIHNNVFPHWLIMGEVKYWPDLMSWIWKIRDIRFVVLHEYMQPGKFRVNWLTTVSLAEPWTLKF